jgi:hypothetical protein
MRTFKCYECEHTWQIPFGEGSAGSSLICPECGSGNVHRVHNDRGRDNKLHAVGSFLNRGKGRGSRWSR